MELGDRDILIPNAESQPETSVISLPPQTLFDLLCSSKTNFLTLASFASMQRKINSRGCDFFLDHSDHCDISLMDKKVPRQPG